jgi:hypothetical protein
MEMFGALKPGALLVIARSTVVVWSGDNSAGTSIQPG